MIQLNEEYHKSYKYMTLKMFHTIDMFCKIVKYIDGKPHTYVPFGRNYKKPL
jgi:hypothetical protein